jgi:hypothetical protein
MKPKDLEERKKELRDVRFEWEEAADNWTTDVSCIA